MSKNTLLAFFALSLATASCAAQNPDAVSLLKRSDAYRNGWNSFVMKVRITSYVSGKSDEEKRYEVSQKGVDKTYIESLSPLEKGQHLLTLGDDMWISLPGTSHPLRITPLERLAGEASNGDVARTNYAMDYLPVYVRKEKVGNQECDVLELTAQSKGATYHKIIYWLRAENARPVKAEFYLTSGKLFKSVTFDRYCVIAGHEQLQKLTLYDEIHHNAYSVLEYSDVTPRQLPDRLFNQGRADTF